MCALPSENQVLLRYIVCLCHQIRQHDQVTQMNAQNLAIVFAPNILRQKEESIVTAEELNTITAEQRMKQANDSLCANQVIAYLLEHDVAVFGEEIVSLIDNYISSDKSSEETASVGSSLSSQLSIGSQRSDESMEGLMYCQNMIKTVKFSGETETEEEPGATAWKKFNIKKTRGKMHF